MARARNLTDTTVSLGDVPADHLIEVLEDVLRFLNARIVRRQYDVGEPNEATATIVSYYVESNPT